MKIANARAHTHHFRLGKFDESCVKPRWQQLCQNFARVHENYRQTINIVTFYNGRRASLPVWSVTRTHFFLLLFMKRITRTDWKSLQLNNSHHFHCCCCRCCYCCSLAVRAAAAIVCAIKSQTDLWKMRNMAQSIIVTRVVFLCFQSNQRGNLFKLCRFNGAARHGFLSALVTIKL